MHCLFHARILNVLRLLDSPLNELFGCHLLAKVKVVCQCVISDPLGDAFQLDKLLLLFFLGTFLELIDQLLVLCVPHVLQYLHPQLIHTVDHSSSVLDLV